MFMLYIIHKTNIRIIQVSLKVYLLVWSCFYFCTLPHLGNDLASIFFTSCLYSEYSYSCTLPYCFRLQWSFLIILHNSKVISPTITQNDFQFSQSHFPSFSFVSSSGLLCLESRPKIPFLLLLNSFVFFGPQLSHVISTKKAYLVVHSMRCPFSALLLHLMQTSVSWHAHWVL